MNRLGLPFGATDRLAAEVRRLAGSRYRPRQHLPATAA